MLTGHLGCSSATEKDRCLRFKVSSLSVTLLSGSVSVNDFVIKAFGYGNYFNVGG